MNLLVDIGNSRLKWVESVDGQLGDCRAFAYDSNNFVDSLHQQMNGLSPPAEILVANVAGENLACAFQEYTLGQWSVQPQFVQVAEKAAGVTNAYNELDQLGIDRWLAAVAAWNRYKEAVCIVDCGTAMTLDIVSDEGLYEGGYIIPGQGLMTEALGRNTRQIDVAAGIKRQLRPGRSTLECVGNGTLSACVYTIDSSLRKFREDRGEKFHAVITGGGADDIIPHLEQEIDSEPNLVLHGLTIVAREKK